MSLTLRNVKGSPLTYTEMDNNLTYLEGVAGATGGTGILDDLVVSGTSSLGDVVIADGKVIKSANTNINIPFKFFDGDFGFDDGFVLGRHENLFAMPVVENDAFQFIGQSGLDYLLGFSTYDGGFEVGHYSNTVGNNRIGFYTPSAFIEMTDDKVHLNSGTSYIYINSDDNDYIDIKSDEIFFGAAGRYPLWLCDNRTANQTANNTDKYGVFIGTRNSTINSGIVNSVVVGGTGITASANNTVYVPDLVVQNGKTINAQSGGGQLDLRNGADGTISLNNNGSFGDGEYLYMEPTYIELSSVITGGSRVNIFADEYGAGLGLGDAAGIRNGDFEVYGKNGFLIENRTNLLDEAALNIKHDDLITINCLKVLLPTIPTYADNAAAVADSHPTNAIYKTSTGELRIVV